MSKQYIPERVLYERFDSFLNELSEPVKICGYEYDPSVALKQVDEIAYDQEFSSWLDCMLTEGHLFEKDGEYYDEDPNEGEDTNE